MLGIHVKVSWEAFARIGWKGEVRKNWSFACGHESSTTGRQSVAATNLNELWLRVLERRFVECREHQRVHTGVTLGYLQAQRRVPGYNVYSAISGGRSTAVFHFSEPPHIINQIPGVLFQGEVPAWRGPWNRY